MWDLNDYIVPGADGHLGLLVFVDRSGSKVVLRKFKQQHLFVNNPCFFNEKFLQVTFELIVGVFGVFLKRLAYVQLVDFFLVYEITQ
jgi:hypothetical protein